MSNDHFVVGDNPSALFSLKVHRGEGMCLLAMDWKGSPPPSNFVGFAIEYSPPARDDLFPVKNRIAFPGRSKKVSAGKAPEQYSSTEAPFQTFRWTHFSRASGTQGKFTYVVTPMFMNAEAVLYKGARQSVKIDLGSETMPNKLNIAFTRGYVSSQSFVDKFDGDEGLRKLIPPSADEGLDFIPTHSKAAEAYRWMGLEARDEILTLLDDAHADGADTMVVAFELNLPEVLERLEKIGPKLRIIIDDSSNLRKNKNGQMTGTDKAAPESPESRSAARLKAAGAQVQRQHMSSLQHNKMIIVDGPTVKKVVLGSTNFSWRGFFVQANNLIMVRGAAIVAQQVGAFDAYWGGTTASFSKSAAADWRSLGVSGLDANISMSPHSSTHSTQKSIAAEIDRAKGSLFYSLAFLSQTKGPVTEAIKHAAARADLFVYGMADKPTGFSLMQPGGNPVTMSPASLGAGLPEPFRSEAKGGSGVKMHHKFVVIDFNMPDARVYSGSYNFSAPADTKNGENLLLIRDPKIATSYMVEALRLFDSYQFRQAMKEAKQSGEPKTLKFPPKDAATKPWWDKFYSDPIRIRDRALFA